MKQGALSFKKVQDRIYLIRNERVMLDQDLALMYGVPLKRLVEACKRNKARFPGDFMYQLTAEEHSNLRSQIATSSWGGRRYLPYVFTEQGVAMLSSVLNSPKAIQVNIQIIRTFVQIREVAWSYRDISYKIDELEKKYDRQFQVIFKAIKMLLEKPKDDPGHPRRF